jgi:hypothetical protein
MNVTDEVYSRIQFTTIKSTNIQAAAAYGVHAPIGFPWWRDVIDKEASSWANGSQLARLNYHFESVKTGDRNKDIIKL